MSRTYHRLERIKAVITERFGERPFTAADLFLQLNGTDGSVEQLQTLERQGWLTFELRSRRYKRSEQSNRSHFSSSRSTRRRS